jgi:hypothetical protein
MFILLIVSLIVGLFVTGISGVGFFGIVVGGAFFLFGLPGALICSLIHGEVSYTQDRADYRQQLSDSTAIDIAEEHELAEDVRLDRLNETIKKNPKQVFNDNRQVHVHGGHQ